MSLSQDPEAFIGIRQMAAMSLAVFSIGSYIIGIGDRHLDNFLLNLTKYALKQKKNKKKKQHEFETVSLLTTDLIM
jgi:hypothetical protein